MDRASDRGDKPTVETVSLGFGPPRRESRGDDPSDGEVAAADELLRALRRDDPKAVAKAYRYLQQLARGANGRP